MDRYEELLHKYGLTPKTYEQCLQEIHDKVLGIDDQDWSDIVAKYNLPMSKDTVRKASSQEIFGNVFVMDYFRNKQNKQSDIKLNNDATQNYRTEIAINKDGSFLSNKLITMSEDDLKNPESLLKAHGFDVREWELVSAKNNAWNAYSKQDGIKELYSSRIVIKPRTEEVDCDKINEWFDSLDRKYSLPKVEISDDYLNGDKCLLIDIADLHLNLQAPMFSTGNEYNCDIAEKLFFYVINDVISRTDKYQFNKIIFCIGGDMLNGDNLSGATTKGTPQDSDLLYFDAVERLYSMTIKAIDILREKAPVQVVYVSGNHDKLSGYKLAKYIEAWFRNDNRVSVDYSPLPRKYVKFGKTLFVFAHDGNVKTLPRLIADEAREYWSEIDTTEVFLQHLHTEQVLTEEYNMRIQRLPTISAKSNWTVDKGFGSKRQCKTFIFDKFDGLCDILYTPIKTNPLYNDF